jgi:DNA-binding NtrC family response regulator
LPLARPSMLPPPPSVGGAFAPRFDAPYLAQRDAIVESFTREYLTKLLEATHGNQSEAARIAGLDRTYLGRMLSKMGIGRK